VIAIFILMAAAPTPPQAQPGPGLRRPADWVSNEDYPAAAKGAAGTTHIELTIDAQGVVTDCRILLASGSQVLDDQSCRLLRARAGFRPALDAAGVPIVSTFRRYIRWSDGRNHWGELRVPVDVLVPVNALPAGAKSSVTIRQIESPDRPPSDCAIVESSGAEQLDRMACDFAGQAKLDPLAGPDGKPLRALRTRRVVFQPGS
jgi:TonB family protein